jgi:hypothetical protein
MNPAHHIFRLSVFILALLGSIPLISVAQEAESCAEKLKSAQALFEKGQVEKVPVLLQECMKSGFIREESLSAYKLLIQSYLFEDKLEQADSAMMAFLKKNPEYMVSPTDHSSFEHLFNNFRVKPLVQISFHLGTNVPFLTFIDPHSTATISGKSINSSDAANLYSSLEAKFTLSKKLELNLEAGFSQLSFTNIEEYMGFKEITYIEKQSRLELPLTITYNYLAFGNFTVYGRFGGGIAINLGSSAKPSYKPLGNNNIESYSGADIKRNDSRIIADPFFQIGTGIKYKTPGGFLFMELRSNLGLLNQTVRGGLSAEELSWRIFYEDDDFHINSMNLSIGYTQVFYKPSKRKF